MGLSRDEQIFIGLMVVAVGIFVMYMFARSVTHPSAYEAGVVLLVR